MKAIKLGLQSVIEQLTEPTFEKFCWDNWGKETLLGVILDEIDFFDCTLKETNCGKEWVITGTKGVRTLGEIQVLECIISELHEDVIKSMHKL